VIEISVLSKGDEQAYEAFLKGNEFNMIYVSLKYRNLLKALTDSKDFYLVAKERNKILGVMPTMLKMSKYGNILNSLPFYGSNGGAISNNKTIKNMLIDAFNAIAVKLQAVISTMVTSPFEKDLDIYESSEYDYKGMRIGQITKLPDSEDRLMPLFHQKTRNMVRKAYKEGINFDCKQDGSALDFLFDTHRQNMQAINLPFKNREFFNLVSKIFEYGKDYKIYVANLNGMKISALLLLYYNKTAEYFVPATVANHRNLQPNSLLIHEAMRDAIKRGFKYWNWGGTADYYSGVYHFKKHWGTIDRLYYYYTKVHGNLSDIKKLGKNGILKKYPYFYVMPFDRI